jgi:hypothetical protein
VQQRRLHKENQPLEQLDRVIEEIREVDGEVNRRSSQQGEAEQKEILQEQQGRRSSSNNNKAEEQMDNSKEKFGIQEDFNKRVGEIMRRSS